MNKFSFVAIFILLALVGYGVARFTSRSSPLPRKPAAANHQGNRHSPLSIAGILSDKPPSLRGYDRHKLRTIIATGDVIPARSVNYHMTIYHNFDYPFLKTAPYLRTGDITLIDLESPLVPNCPVTAYGMSFCGDPQAVQGLTYASVDVACTANNHIGNYGSAGIQDTWGYLRDDGIKPCGLGLTAYVNVRGLRFAFLAYNAVGQRFDYAEARSEIHQARKHADVVIVEMHWGREYVAVPTTAPGIADDYPPTMAHFMINSGADLIIGNHPHHVQAIELYHGRLITYAHGNFVFDQMFSSRNCPGSANFACSTREGVVGAYTFYGKKLVAVHYRPVLIFNYSQPRWTKPGQSHIIRQGMLKASRTLAKREHASKGYGGTGAS